MIGKIWHQFYLIITIKYKPNDFSSIDNIQCTYNNRRRNGTQLGVTIWLCFKLKQMWLYVKIDKLGNNVVTFLSGAQLCCVPTSYFDFDTNFEHFTADWIKAFIYCGLRTVPNVIELYFVYNKYSTILVSIHSCIRDSMNQNVNFPTKCCFSSSLKPFHSEITVTNRTKHDFIINS